MSKRGSNRGGRSNGGFERKQISQETKDMQDQASKWNDIIKNADTEDIERKTKGLFNKITPDNYRKLRSQAFEIQDNVYFVLMNAEEGSPEYEDAKSQSVKFIKVFFKKATLEEKYCSMYTNLLKYILEKEYEKYGDNMDGSESPTKSPSKTKNFSKASKFRNDIIEECKSTLLEFQEEMKNQGGSEIDKADFEFRYKRRLFGNLKFIAELFKKKIVSRPVPLYVLSHLLGIYGDEGSYNDFTIEGACTFVAKVGSKLDKQKSGSSPRKGDTSSKSNDNSKFDAVIDKLLEFQFDDKVDTRIQFIIKNTLSMRELGWKDKDNEDGPKTKSQIKKEHMAGLQGGDDYEEPRYQKNKSQSFKKKSKPYHSDKNVPYDNRPDSFALKMGKMTSTTSVISEATEDMETPKAPAKNYSPREIEHHDHESLKDKLIGNFSEWQNTNKLETSLFVEMSKHLPGSTMINYMLIKLYDKGADEVTKFNEFFMLLHNSKLKPDNAASHNKGHSGQLFGKKEIEEGISKFFLIIPNIESDLPKLAEQFTELLYFIFIDKNLADFSKVEIKLESDDELEEDEEPIYMIDIYVKVLAAFLTKVESRLGDSKLEHFYEHYNIAATIDTLRPHVMGDYTDDDTTISESVLKKFNLDP
jgi:hypothetical protein